MRIAPAHHIEGTITLPGDKSISHRAAIIASLSNGTSVIENFSGAEDCQTTLRCLRQLGVAIEIADGRVTVHGVGKRGLQRPAEPLDCGNSGTTMRLLAGVLAGQAFESVLTGDESLLKRPMRRIVEPLREMGSAIEADNDRPPIRIFPSDRLNGIEYRPTIASAEVKSCLLLAGLNAAGTTTVLEPTATRDHTERMLKFFGVTKTVDGERISISGDAILTAADISIPADISAAAFFLVAAAILPGSSIKMPNVGVNPSRTEILQVLRTSGLHIGATRERNVANEPIADLEISSGALPSGSPMSISGSTVASLIDEMPILAVVGTQLDAGLEVREAAELRYKESDRIAVVVDNLQRMHADVEEFPDGFRVGKSRLRGADIDSCGDHRIAMAFSIAALVADGESTIRGAECADISFPGFFETLKSVVR